MTEYYFDMRRSPEKDRYAEYDSVGDSICIFLEEFMHIEDGLISYGEIHDDIVIAVLKAVLIHEDIHAYINPYCDIGGDQEHSTVYEWIKEILD